MPLRLVLFDLWGTLFQHEGPGEDHGRGELRKALLLEALVAVSRSYTAETVAEAMARAEAELSAIHAEGRDIAAEARTVLFVRHIDGGLGEKLDDAAWYSLHRAMLTPALSARPDVMPGAVDVLREVKTLGVPVGLVSNAGATPGFVLREIMDGYGLLEHFDDTVFSDEVELAKPAAAIFERAIEPFGVTPAGTAFVGDQPLLDVFGPRNAGIWTVQLGDLTSDGIEPHARITSLHELLPALRQLGLID